MRNPLVAMDDRGIEAARSALAWIRRRTGRGKAATIRDVRLAGCSMSAATIVLAFPYSQPASAVGLLNLAISYAHFSVWRSHVPDDETVHGMSAEQRRSSDRYVSDRAPRIVLAVVAVLLVAVLAVDLSGLLEDSKPEENAVSVLFVVYYLSSAVARYLEAAPPPPPAAAKSEFPGSVFAGR